MRFALFLFVWVGLTTDASAYVSYNRLGYVSCTACHFTSTGGGLLSPYGRTVGAAMAAKSAEIFPDERRFYAGIHARALELDETRRANPFLMQADALGEVSISSVVRAELTAGLHVDQGRDSFATVPGGADAWLVRRALLGITLGESDSLEIGRDTPMGGLNVDDHTSFLRTTNRRGIEDYPTQLRYVRQTEKWLITPHVFLPSYEELEVNQEYGGGARVERLLNDRNSVGGTGSYGRSDAISRWQLGAFARLSLSHDFGLMAEALHTNRRLSSSSTSFSQQNLYLRPYVSFPEWIETSLIYDYVRASEPYALSTWQWGPEMNVRLHEFVSLIGDGRQVTTQTRTQWSWYAQLFLHVQI